MNVIQQTAGRRDRLRAARRDVFLDATRALIAEHGIESLTVKSVAERVDCAVGTLYTYFPSKSSLLAAVQAEAITRIGSTYALASELLEGDLARSGLSVEVVALTRLVAFGRSVIAVSRVLPEEFRFQQRVLDTSVKYEQADLALVAPLAFDVLARPERLLREAALLEVIDPGDAFSRTVSWLAAVNGVLNLELIPMPGSELFDGVALADRLHLDLLRGWGAPPDLLAVAERAASLERIRELLEESVVT